VSACFWPDANNSISRLPRAPSPVRSLSIRTLRSLDAHDSKLVLPLIVSVAAVSLFLRRTRYAGKKKKIRAMTFRGRAEILGRKFQESIEPLLDAHGTRSLQRVGRTLRKREHLRALRVYSARSAMAITSGLAPVFRLRRRLRVALAQEECRSRRIPEFAIKLLAESGEEVTLHTMRYRCIALAESWGAGSLADTSTLTGRCPPRLRDSLLNALDA